MRYVIGMDLADPCQRCGREHDVVVIDNAVQPCPPSPWARRWTTRMAHGLAHALAALSRLVAGQ